MDEGVIVEEAAPDAFFTRPVEERTRRFLELFDAQHLLVFPIGGEHAVAAALAGNRLWNALDAVRGDRVRYVEGHWGGGGPLAQLAMLDDLGAWFGQD